MVSMQHYIPIAYKNNKFKLSKEDNHHIIHVLRMSMGDMVYVIFSGKRYKCQLVMQKNDLELHQVEVEELKTELPVKIKLIYGLPRLEKFELVLQKAVELGVSSVVPFISEYSIVKLEADRLDSKMLRWNKIIKEASEQSHRSKLMEVLPPIKINDLRVNLSEINIVADENKSSNGTNDLVKILKSNHKSITILVGPEGGFSPSELKIFSNLGFKSVSLGKRILRSETAAIYLISSIALFAESID
jgi:16S rRNA (uracil1498-N3)-methyltransferase